MYNNDNGQKKGRYLIRIKNNYVYLNGSYCWIEIQIGSWMNNFVIQLFTRNRGWIRFEHYVMRPL